MGLSQYIGASAYTKPGVCTSTTRPAAPYTGQVIFETDTNKMLVWNTSAWVIPNSPAQDPPGMGLIYSATVGTAVPSVTVSNCFNSTYDNYKIMWSGGISSGSANMKIQLTNITGANYRVGLSTVNFSTGTATNQGQSGITTFDWAGYADTTFALVDADIYNPFSSTKYKYFQSKYIGNTFGGAITGFCADTTSSTGFTLSTGGASITGGTLAVYGYRK